MKISFHAIIHLTSNVHGPSNNKSKSPKPNRRIHVDSPVLRIFLHVLSFLSRMDSFFLAEMFKYLFLLFAEAEDLPFDVEDYVFTTEAHLLPLSLSTAPHASSIPTNRTVIKFRMVKVSMHFIS